MSIFIFILNSRYDKDPLLSVKIEQDMVKAWDSKIRMKFLFDLSIDDLKRNMDKIVQEYQENEIKNIFVFFSGHGAMSSDNDLLFSTIDDETIKINEFINTYFRDTRRNIFIMYDACRGYIGYKINDKNLQTLILRGCFFMLNGAVKNKYSTGKLSNAFLKYLSNEIHEKTTFGVILFKIDSFLRENKHIPTTFYANSNTRTEYEYIIDSIQELTGQSDESVMATRIGIKDDCSQLLTSFNRHTKSKSHDLPICLAYLKQFHDKCKETSADIDMKDCIACCRDMKESIEKLNFDDYLEYLITIIKIKNLQSVYKIQKLFTYILGSLNEIGLKISKESSLYSRVQFEMNRKIIGEKLYTNTYNKTIDNFGKENPKFKELIFE